MIRENKEGKEIISAFLAGYARLRDWPSNNEERKAVSDALKPFLKNEKIQDPAINKNLLNERKYIVLQGPPGTGKTRFAKKVAEKIKSKNIFYSVSF